MFSQKCLMTEYILKHFNFGVKSTDQSALWSLPYSGQVRLRGGNYVTDGRVEIYCNDQWGTVCNTYVDLNSANTVCIQLGYSTAQSYGNKSL